MRLGPPLILRLQYALTAAAGALDVFCVTRLGGAFASIITGNLIQVGSAVVGSDLWLAGRCAIAVVGYAVGVACGAVALRRVPIGWTGRTTAVTVAEFALLAAVAVIWRAAYGHTGSAAYGHTGGAAYGHTGGAAYGQTGGAVQGVMLGLASMAMGLQSASTVTSGLPGAATTYFTGTLTNAIRTMVTESQGLARGSRAALRLVALLAGAVGGGLAQQLAPAWAPALPALIVAAVLLLAFTRRPRD